jgi:hypothetical protein
MTNSSVLLPDPNVDIKKKVENVINAVIGEDHGTVTIPGPTRQNIPISEFTTQYFFTTFFLISTLGSCKRTLQLVVPEISPGSV